jgi:hypothetical protein
MEPRCIVWLLGEADVLLVDAQAKLSLLSFLISPAPVCARRWRAVQT